jgi:serine/threonine protein phosphatase PrpC
MLEVFGLSDKGRVRQNNEDYFIIDTQLGLYLVADGMGGARAGERASRLAAETVRDHIRRIGHPSPETLVRAFEEANLAVLRAAGGDKEFEGMGTTLVAVLETGQDLCVASVGDSRAYLYDAPALIPITEDQTWVQEVGRRLGIDEASLRKHPMRHVLTMAIGITEDLRIHSYQVQLKPGNMILLSSDGLHGVVEAEALCQVLCSGDSLEQKCRLLVQAALDRGAPDNVTVVLLQAQ